MSLIHRRFLPGELKAWVLRDVGRPLLSALPVIMLSRWLLPLPASRLMILGVISLVWGLSAASAAFAIPELRKEIVDRTVQLFAFLRKRLKTSLLL
jgi:hypothetical protein